MKIYYIATLDAVGYDEYDSCVVAASDELEAKEIALENCYNFEDGRLKVEEIGLSNDDKAGMILESYNAG